MTVDPFLARCAAPQRAYPPGTSPRGFTLTELLVVILIIGLLLAVTVSALLGALGTSRAAATRALIEKLDRGLMDRLASLESRKIQVLAIDTLLADDGDADTSDEPLRALVIAKKRLVKEEFPQWFQVRDPANPANLYRDAAGNIRPVGDWDPVWIDFDGSGAPGPGEVQAPSQLSPVAQGYRATVIELSSTPGTVDGALLANHDPRTTSAECLYLILTQGPGASSVDPVEFTHREVEDTDRDGLPELIDGYGLPIRFYRWPTHFRSPLQKGDGPYGQLERRREDRNDPNRLLMLYSWASQPPAAPRRVLFEQAGNISPEGILSWWPALHWLTAPTDPTTDGIDNDGDTQIDEADEIYGLWTYEVSLDLAGTVPPLNVGPGGSYGAFSRPYDAIPLIVSSGPDEQFGLDVLPAFYAQARLLSNWYPNTAAYQTAIQGSLFAESMGGFDEQIGAHLDNITNHDLRSDQ